ncbi:MAG: ATP-dependent zinc metalloprotease FtsH [Bacteroidota bacterium]|nr:ATP-dependent zinc metalloprotease FtsH [Bacteroidota bacterium]
MTNIPEPSGMKPETETPAESKTPVNERTTKKEQRPVSSNGKNASRSGEKRPAPKRNNMSPKLPPNRQGNETNLSHIFRTLLLWAVMFVGVAGLFFLFKGNGEPAEVEVTNTRYQQLLADGKFQNGKIEQYGLNQYRFHGTFKHQETIENPVAGKAPVTTEHIVTNLIPETLNDQYKIWNEKGLTISKEDSTSTWMDGLVSFLPWIILGVFWIFLMRRMQNQGMNGPKGIFSFGKSRAKLADDKAPKVTFADVSGADEAKVELQEIIEFLKEPTKFQRLGGKIPRGVLLLGPPGTGKTLLARAVAGEAGVPFLSISGADFVEMFVGVGASRVRDLFDQAKKNAPCIVFIDEIDAVGRHRGAGLGGGHDEREQTLNQLLVEMDGFDQNNGVIIMAATNRPDVLDPALLRPGRFDRQVVVDRPDVRGREGILKVHTRLTPLASDVDLEVLAKGTPGLSGADLANLVNEAALLAARRNVDRITMQDFENAKDKVMMGVERTSFIISDEEKKTTAYHESGHVLVARMIPDADPVHKVTIIPRGRALGVTSYLPIDEKHTYSREYLEAVIAYALGGRAAEKLIFNRITTGAGNDIERATDIARKMVCDWGMSEKLGPLKYGQGEHEVFLGRDMSNSKTFSDSTGRMIDEEIRHIVETGMERADKILKDNIHTLHRMSLELLTRETLNSTEIDIIIAGGTLPPFEKKKPVEKTKEKFTIADNVKIPPLGDLGGIAPMPA